jgi:hypothetical protein
MTLIEEDPPGMGTARQGNAYFAVSVENRVRLLRLRKPRSISLFERETAPKRFDAGVWLQAKPKRLRGSPLPRACAYSLAARAGAGVFLAHHLHCRRRLSVIETLWGEL